MNQAYFTEYQSFAEVYPERIVPNSLSYSRQKKDYFDQVVDVMGDGFMLGSDHYYNLGQTWRKTTRHRNMH